MEKREIELRIIEIAREISNAISSHDMQRQAGRLEVLFELLPEDREERE